MIKILLTLALAFVLLLLILVGVIATAMLAIVALDIFLDSEAGRAFMEWLKERKGRK